MFTKLLSIILELLMDGIDNLYWYAYNAVMYLSDVSSKLAQHILQVFQSALSFLLLLNLFVPVDLLCALVMIWIGWRMFLHSKKFIKWLIEVITP